MDVGRADGLKVFEFQSRLVESLERHIIEEERWNRLGRGEEQSVAEKAWQGVHIYELCSGYRDFLMEDTCTE